MKSRKKNRKKALDKNHLSYQKNTRFIGVARHIFALYIALPELHLESTTFTLSQSIAHFSYNGRAQWHQSQRRIDITASCLPGKFRPLDAH